MAVTVFAVPILRANIWDEYLGYMDNLTTVRPDTPMPLLIGIFVPTHACSHQLQSMMDTDNIAVLHPWVDEIIQNINDLIIKNKKLLAHQMYLDSRQTMCEVTVTNAAGALAILLQGHTFTL